MSLLSHALSKCYDPMMKTEQIVVLLIAERDRLSRAIDALQRPAKRPGKTPGAATKRVSATSPAIASAPVARKRTMSAAGRKAIAEAAKRRWAAIKAGKAKSPFATPAEKKA